MQRLFRVWLVVAAATASAGAHAQRVDVLKVLSFNVWSAEQTQAGRAKLTEIIEASGADIVGLQEMGSAAGKSIAAALGFHYHQPASVLSRFPIKSPTEGNLGVEIELSPGQSAWVFNTHLAAYPYQPYDLRDGVLPMNEAAVVAAANSARGGQLTTFLSSIQGPLAGGGPVFFTGDFNEPSYLDWTAEVAAATPRSYDFEVEYPASKRVADAGMTDSFRAVRPDPISDPGYTWTPGYPPPNYPANEVHDRIDFVYYRGFGVSATESMTLGPADGDPNTDVSVPGYNSDHRGVVSTFRLATVGDVDANGVLDAVDWAILRDNQHADLSSLTLDQVWRYGDLNGDWRNDHADFVIFKGAFDATHGAGAFAAMATAVPEPAAWVMLAAIWPIMAGSRRLIARQPGPRTG